jgi:hypothetical protein
MTRLTEQSALVALLERLLGRLDHGEGHVGMVQLLLQLTAGGAAFLARAAGGRTSALPLISASQLLVALL